MPRPRRRLCLTDRGDFAQTMHALIKHYSVHPGITQKSLVLWEMPHQRISWVFNREEFDIAYEDNFAVKWETKLIHFPFRNLNKFPPNPLNEYKTVMQSKNC